MLIDCDTCSVRGSACAGCVMTALLDPPAGIAHLDESQLRAIEVLARGGLEVTVISSEAAPLRRHLRASRYHRGVA
jgi:hypothetical protein